ncbi:hypothetical protein [Streptomyces flavofungini]|uniref:hypothetical protein n=1 Tax=Streptomyces flavofungini TaxID=68200 RepID=UPI0025B1971D|nr:hypothetical protein [Streptomyces flavofungini]WJV51778.1 hypothetical protein QUY26_39825 [Streptomyces flavofungini]
MTFLQRLVSPLRRIDADPDKLVEDAYWLLKEAEKNKGVWPVMTAFTSMATAKVQIAQYLKEHRDS